MHCPECNSLNETNAAACPSCGLLMLNLVSSPAAASLEPAQKRRSEDYAGQKRRARDREVAACQFCGGEIDAKAIRCKHCSEIINEDFYRERAQKLRSRINYGSWVAYMFGLAALVVFRPVGLVSIGAGLLLSILYYAIPAEPPPTKGAGEKTPLLKRVLRQLKFERVSIPIPNFGKKKLVFVGTPLVAALIGYTANMLLVQQPMNQVLKENSAFAGMEVSAHYQYWVVPGVVVYDLRQLGVRQTPIDVHTAFLEFAKKMREKKLQRVDLSYKGTTKFSIDGNSFQQVGNEYAKQNFDYVLYRLPRLFHSVGSHPAALPVGDKNRDALLQFHRQWYGNDQLTRTVANGL